MPFPLRLSFLTSFSSSSLFSFSFLYFPPFVNILPCSILEALSYQSSSLPSCHTEMLESNLILDSPSLCRGAVFRTHSGERPVAAGRMTSTFKSSDACLLCRQILRKLWQSQSAWVANDACSPSWDGWTRRRVGKRSQLPGLPCPAPACGYSEDDQGPGRDYGWREPAPAAVPVIMTTPISHRPCSMFLLDISLEFLP